MAIENDFFFDTQLRMARFTGGFNAVTGLPITTNPLGAEVPYTGRDFYKLFQDTVDETDPIRQVEAITGQTNNAFQLSWFMDDLSFKALYGSSFTTTGWEYSASLQDGITQIRYTSGSSDAPDEATDRGVVVTQATSGATGQILATDATRRVAWIRNTNGTQFDDTNNITGTGVDFDPESDGIASGESRWVNLFTDGIIQALTEVRVAQYDDRMGGDNTLKTLTPWWNARQQFPSVAVNPSGANAGQVDLVIKVVEAGRLQDNADIYAYGKRWGNTYAFGVLRGGLGRASIVLETNDDSAISDGYRSIDFDGGSGGTVEVGDIIRLQGVAQDRAIVFAVPADGATGTVEYALIGPGTDFADDDAIEFFDTALVSQKTADVDGAPIDVNAATFTNVTHDFGFVEFDLDNGNGNRPYGVELDPASRVFSQVHARNQYVTRDLETADIDGTAQTVEGQFYRGIGEELIGFDAQSGVFTEGERVAFDILETGTDAAANAAGTQLTSASATFIANGVLPGHFIFNETDGSFAVIISVDSETQLTHSPLAGGTDDDWDLNDNYSVGVGTGVLTMFDDTGDRLVVRDRRGTSAPADNDQIRGLSSGATADVDGAPTAIAENRASPFGSLAGALFSAAQGVGIDPSNVNGADITNYRLIDLTGVAQVPPNAVSVLWDQVAIGDRPFIAEVLVAGQPALRKNQHLCSGGEAQYDTTIDVTATIGNSRPAAGELVLVDDSVNDNNRELRYRYSSRAGSTFTLVASASGTTTGATTTDSGKTLIDAAADFGGADDVEIGDVVNNETTGEFGIIEEVVSTTELRLTGIGNKGIGLTAGEWNNGDTYSINTLANAVTASDTIYVPYVNRVAASSQEGATVVHTIDVPIVARNRHSSENSGAPSKIKPQVVFGSITSTGFSATAARDVDPQAA